MMTDDHLRVYPAGHAKTLGEMRSRIAELETELAEARKDGELLDALEKLVANNKRGGLLLHHQMGGHVEWSGSGLGLSHRTLRQAIAQTRGTK